MRGGVFPFLLLFSFLVIKTCLFYIVISEVCVHFCCCSARFQFFSRYGYGRRLRLGLLLLLL